MGTILWVAGIIALVAFVAVVIETMESAFIIISAISTTLIAIFAWRSWKISIQQHKMYYDPDLRVYPLVQRRGFVLTFGYGVILVNPGRVPITITEIKEPKIARLQWDFMQQKRSERVMNELPWVIEGGNFVTCIRFVFNQSNRRKLKGKRIKIAFQYYVAERLKKVSKEISMTNVGPP